MKMKKLFMALLVSQNNSEFDDIKQATLQPSLEKSNVKNKTVMSIDDPVLFKSK